MDAPSRAADVRTLRQGSHKSWVQPAHVSAAYPPPGTCFALLVVFWLEKYVACVLSRADDLFATASVNGGEKSNGRFWRVGCISSLVADCLPQTIIGLILLRVYGRPYSRV